LGRDLLELRMRSLFLRALWGLIFLGLLMRVLRQPEVVGTYNPRVDELLYAGQRLLDGQLLFDGLVNGTLPLAQLLYAPSAWLGTIKAHYLLTLGLNVFGGLLLALAMANLARVGLLTLTPGSLLPAAGAMFFVIFSQMLSGGPSGLLEHFANLFLVISLFILSQVATCANQRHPFRTLQLAGAGAVLVLALGSSPRWISPMLMVAVVGILVLRISRPFSVLLPALAGGLATVLLLFSPYLLCRDGPSLAWAGSVLLPLELASRSPPEINRFIPLLLEFLSLKVAGLPVWLLALVPCLALLEYIGRLARRPLGLGDQVLLVPGLAFVFLLETLSAFMRGGFEIDEMQLLIVPLVIIMICGFAVLERSFWRRRAGGFVLLVLSFILFNNVFLVSVLHQPRQPNAMVRALEADRDATRRFLLSHPGEGFTAPQDVALQRQLHQRASTTGIGPEWSLNPRQLKPSWATRKLLLPTDPSAVCEQLTDPANQHLVWMRTDPDGPNTEAFFRACLNRQPGRWEDISDQLKLSSGQYRLFRRRTEPLTPSAQGHAL
jgi:hypothetical protein